MTVAFHYIPAAPEASFVRRTRPPAPTRRTLLRGAAGTATAIAFGALTTLNAAVAKAAYFREYTQIHAGPCAPGGYADRDADQGLRCGPSQICRLAAGASRPRASTARGGTAPAPSAPPATRSARTSAGPARTRRGAGSSPTAVPTAARTATGSRTRAPPRRSARGRYHGSVCSTARAASPARQALTSPVLPLALLSAAAGGLLAAGRGLAAVCAVAAVAGVALPGIDVKPEQRLGAAGLRWGPSSRGNAVGVVRRRPGDRRAADRDHAGARRGPRPLVADGRLVGPGCGRCRGPRCDEPAGSVRAAAATPRAHPAGGVPAQPGARFRALRARVRVGRPDVRDVGGAVRPRRAGAGCHRRPTGRAARGRRLRVGASAGPAPGPRRGRGAVVRGRRRDVPVQPSVPGSVVVAAAAVLDRLDRAAGGSMTSGPGERGAR